MKAKEKYRKTGGRKDRKIKLRKDKNTKRQKYKKTKIRKDRRMKRQKSLKDSIAYQLLMTGAISHLISDDLVYNEIFKEQFCGERDFAVALEFNQSAFVRCRTNSLAT